MLQKISEHSIEQIIPKCISLHNNIRNANIFNIGNNKKLQIGISEWFLNNDT